MFNSLAKIGSSYNSCLLYTSCLYCSFLCRVSLLLCCHAAGRHSKQAGQNHNSGLDVYKRQEYYAAKNYGVQVIGCPKTIDGDLKNDMM